MIQPNDQSDDSFMIQKICDPFSGPPNYTYAPGNCHQDAIQIHDLPSILSTLTCEKNTPSDICKAEGKFFPESAYGKTMAYIQSIENLIATYPDLQSLAGCTPLKHAIADVATRQCEPFRASVKLLWASILTLSIDLMILTLFWIIKAYQEKGRHFSLCSIVPRNHQQSL
ncbi:putative transmembrane protein [Helianthus debilis subsp. tardiflorus]